MEETEQTEVLMNCKNSIVFLFFRGASKHRIAVKTEHEMRKLQERYNEIILNF